MALAMASMAGLRGSSQVPLEGSIQMSGSTRLNIPTKTMVALTRPGFTVRAQAQQQVLAEPEPETSRRAAVLSLVAGGLASGFFVPSVFAAPKSIPVGSTPPPSGGLLYNDQQREMAAVAAATRVFKVAAIGGSLSSVSKNKGLIRAAIQIAKDSIPELEIEDIDISKLQMLNTDDIADGAAYPGPVKDFRKKILRADCILFSTPEYNYSITGALKNAIDWGSLDPDVWVDKPAAILSTGGDFGGGRAQYQLRQMGVRVDLHFINKPEFFLNVYEDPAMFDGAGNLVDEGTKKRLKQMLLSLLAFTQRLQDEC